MKTLTLIACSVFLVFAVNAQTLAPQVVAAAGDHFNSPSGSIEFTLGEGVIETFAGTNTLLTQGFHQVMFLITEVKETGIPATNEVKIYPNPASDHVYLEMHSTLENPVYFLELRNSSGQILGQKRLNGQHILEQFDVRELQPGTLFFRISAKDNSWSKTFKIMTIH